MAIMYPKNIDEYLPTESERIVYYSLKNNLPDSYEVFYSVKWTTFENGSVHKSESDFVVTSPEYGFLCLEVKGGSKLRIEDNIWYVEDTFHGERKLSKSPYDQAEKSMYYLFNTYSNKYNMKYSGIYGAGAVFPFYPVKKDEIIDNRNRICTIDCNDMNHIYEKIKQMFRFWAGTNYGRRFYSTEQHHALMELIRERIAISAAAGALVEYKNQQLNVINRVQDNYIYFISNVKQFYVRGGAGTGKTWIAMKMAKIESSKNKRVLFLCFSARLSSVINRMIGDTVEVKSVYELFITLTNNKDVLKAPLYRGISNHLIDNLPKYDAIFIDEAQDFTFEWAKVIRKMLSDSKMSRLGVFYDDVQVFREDSFGDGFEIDTLPYLLRENIRNTANIYNWTSDKTKLCKDMVANPVEGPTPVTEYIHEKGQLTLALETMFKRYIEEEYLPSDALVLLLDDVDWFLASYENGIAKWEFKREDVSNSNQIRVYSVEEFKGLEADMVIYIHKQTSSENTNYIAYTRAKYYLIEFVRDY